MNIKKLSGSPPEQDSSKLWTDEQLLYKYAYLIDSIIASTRSVSSVIDYDDLYQVGQLALLQGLKSYDPKRGSKITSYLYKTIKRSIYKEAAKFFGPFTIDSRVFTLSCKVHKLYKEGYSIQEIAKRLDISDKKVIQLILPIFYVPLDENLFLQESIYSHDIFRNIIFSELERVILVERILGHISVKDLAQQTGFNIELIYKTEQELKKKIEHIIYHG